MHQQKDLYTNTIFSGELIAASGNAISTPAIDLSKVDGFFSLQIALTGDGTAKFEYMSSNDGTNFITQTGAADQIVTGFVKTSGPGSDGKDMISFDPELCKFLKIKCTETGTANSVTITVTIAIQ